MTRKTKEVKMKWRCIVTAILLLLLVSSCHPTPAPPTEMPSPPEPTPAPTPTPTPVMPMPPPRLYVVGNQIQNEDGENVVLRGVAIADPFFLADPRLYNHFIADDYSILAKVWGANIIRVPIHPELWEWDKEYVEKYLDPLVQWGKEYGLYIFLGWHAHGNPITGEVEHPSWGNRYPWRGNPYNPDLELAKSALKTMAERYLEKPWVLFGTFNEPSYIEWVDWRPVAEELVDVIHAVNPGAIVFVSGIDWGYDLSGAIADPVLRENVVYETHPYPGKGEDWKITLDELRKRSPVFIGEWGFEPGSPNPNLNATTENYGLPLVQYAKERDIGWTAWVWNPYWEPSMLVSWWDYTPTEFGLLVKNSLAQE